MIKSTAVLPIPHGAVLVIHQDRKTQHYLSDGLSGLGYSVTVLSGCQRGVGREQIERFIWGYLRSNPLGVVLLDIRVVKETGLELIRKSKALNPEALIILIAAYEEFETVVEALKVGADNYVFEPFRVSALLVLIEKSLTHERLRKENAELGRQCSLGSDIDVLLQKNAQMKNVNALVKVLSTTADNVVIIGGALSEQELVARSIHRVGSQPDGRWIELELPKELGARESEKFFEVLRSVLTSMKGGTLLLREPEGINADGLERVLRYCEALTSELRSVAALESEIPKIVITAGKSLHCFKKKHGSCENCVYQQLEHVPVVIPDVCYTKDDIWLVLSLLIRDAMGGSRQFRVTEFFSHAAIKKILSHNWVNKRRLESVVKSVLTNCKGKLVTEEAVVVSECGHDGDGSGLRSFESIKQEYVHHVLRTTGGNRERASHILGVNRRTLWKWLRE
jgi:DNA-binding NtrC family response regulator